MEIKGLWLRWGYIFVLIGLAVFGNGGLSILIFCTRVSPGLGQRS